MRSDSLKMGTRVAYIVCFVVITTVLITVFAESPPVVDYGKPRPPRCQKNEVYRCQETCPGDGCITLYAAINCIANQTCVSDCYCKQGYLRIGRGGPCVPQDQCPPVECASDPNARRGCGDKCGKTCGDYKSNRLCPKRPCKNNGCECKNGYIHDTNLNKCVLPKDCTPKPCRGNQTWMSPCNMPCPYPRCPRDDKAPPPCVDIQPCYPGCQCQPGYKRNSTGHCIQASDCPPVCKDPNASWTNCRAICPGTCLNPKPICISKIVCSPGCQCKKGYVLDDRKICVKIEACPAKPCEGAHEIYMDCPAGQCTPKSCDDLVTPPGCPRIRPPCPGGCVCKAGYLRDKYGKCIPQSQCPKPCKGAHEIYVDCPAGQCTPKSCDDLVTPPGCPRIRPPCPGGCVCKDGYLRDKYGKCIPQSQCPSAQCKKKNERWSNCLLGECRPKTCCEVGFPVACPDIIGPCAGGCICEEGFVRNRKGDCIDMKKCLCCGGDPYAVSGCGNPCGKTCASLYANKSDLICPQYCEYNGCDCKPGYRLPSDDTEDTRKCIPERECPKPPQQCGANEQYYCGTSCPEATCANPTPPTCVNKKCKLACFCIKGYVRDSNNKCVTVDKCPKCKGPNERYINCPKGQCIPKTCKDLIVPPGCPRVIPPCPGGCICEEGYLRDANGKCIRQKQCPNVCKDPNASWTDCLDACPATCQNPKPNCMNKRCSAGCQCNEGYVLSKEGPDQKCVKIETCPDYADCPGNQTIVPCTFRCPQVMCPKSDRTLLCKPPRDCPAGCGCKPYYRYNATGDCVKSSDCPSVECTRLYEEFKCKHLGDWEYCHERYNSPPFWEGDPDDCEPKCTCVNGYYRNPAGDCVLPDECPNVCKDPNASWTDCLDACPATCQNPNPNCMNIRCSAGCQCNEGYVLSKEGPDQKCVRIETCPANVCKDPNASWTDCLDACPATCQNPNPNCMNIRCSAGCQCNEGYVLSKEGPDQKCVRIETCPDYADCPGNQTIVPCTFRCPQVMCPKSDRTLLCKPPRDCPAGCGCKPYYRYNATGDCVKSSDCPSVECTRPYEEFKCKHLGDWEYCHERYNSPPFWEGDPDDCEPKCTCVNGYYRNPAGDCVLPDECPNVCKDPNASWTDCLDACPATCQNPNPNCMNIRCSAGCQCNDGYVLSMEGPDQKCVRIETCPDYTDCPGNQTIVPCTFRCPQVECPKSDQTLLCKPPRDCPAGCGCKPYYRYNATDDCVKSSDCPPVECTRPYEEFKCKHLGDWEYCHERYNSPPFWEGDPDDCEPKCTCVNGYYRNPAGDCVLPDECPPIDE